MAHLDAFRSVRYADDDINNQLEIRWVGKNNVAKDYVLCRVNKKYFLLYVYDGIGHLKNKLGKTEELRAGSVVLFKPYEEQVVWADKAEPFSFYGMVFTGRGFETILKNTALTDGIHHQSEVDHKILGKFESLLKFLLIEEDDCDELLLISNVFAIMARINSKIEEYRQKTVKRQVHNDALARVEEYMHLHYNQRITIHVLAKAAGYSPSWLETHFKQKHGITPVEYLTQIRIKTAQNMLCFNQYNISEVCYAVGYNDPLYFSKVFKRLTQLSPKHYRYLHMADIIE